ncbi:MAG: type I restriction-modification system endonuclease, partial [Bacteroidota bacterium]
MSSPSPNFGFLKAHASLLVAVAASAERHCLTDPVASLTKQRTLAEMLAKQAAAYAALDDDHVDQAARVRLLRDRGVLTYETARLFDAIRRAGNNAAHEHQGSPSDALHHLKLAREVAVWFHRAFGTDPTFRAPRFVPPPDPEKQAAKLGDVREELERLRRRLAEVEEEAEQARELTAAQQADLDRANAEAEAAYAEAEAALQLAEESEAERNRFEAQLDTLRAQQRERPAAERQAVVQSAQDAGDRIELDEADTRRLIDDQLRAAGWEADTQRLRYAKGARPQKGVNQAIAEWPTEAGPADYVLFVGLTPVAVVEAKKQATDVPGSIRQAKRYSQAYAVRGDETLPEEGPWEDYRIPFLFATNGRPYLRQIETKSGIWFLDARRPTNHARALQGWYSPEGLTKLLAQDLGAADAALDADPVDLPGLRAYQTGAIEAVEQAIIDGRQTALLAMATGTGKTRTALALLYRLIKHGRFRRVLFLVDRTALGVQAEGAFAEVKLEGTLSFGDVYDVRALGDLDVDSDTRLHICTVQSLVKRLLYTDDAEAMPPVDQYDCIIVDECHRGYVLDREMSEAELGFRDQSEYVSKYRRVIEYFDAVRIGLTATPALHTTEIFGKPVYTYSYRQAVLDGYLVDHLPPTRIVTQLAEDGIHWEVGDTVMTYNPHTGEIDLAETPDEIDVEIEHFNRLVVTENFNRAVLRYLAGE